MNLNPSSASAGLKRHFCTHFNSAIPKFKPFFGFGWIETDRPKHNPGDVILFKPFFGFGWIETPKPFDPNTVQKAFFMFYTEGSYFLNQVIS
jgi:hypothetical protein